jgi:Holliday junction resolvase-like predicted endonuclease
MAGGKTSRSKGRRGETQAKHLLESRDWTVHDLSAGLKSCDLLAADPFGKIFAVEVKATTTISTAHRTQAMIQGKASKLPWMLMSKIHGAGAWLVQRQGTRPAIWLDNTTEEQSIDN